MALVLSGSIDISGSIAAQTIIIQNGGGGILSSSQQIQNYNLFAVTSSANTFYGNQTINGTLGVLVGGVSELNVQQTGVIIGNSATDIHRVTGSLRVSGSIETQHPTSYGLNRMSATGGQITYSGPFTIHTFTASGTFTTSTTGFVEILAVGGGAAGGGIYGGGGGAGGVVHYKSFNVDAGSHTVTIGQGGTTVDGDAAGNDGNPTYFGSNAVHAMGGGGGGAQNVNTGRNGASGGGNALTGAPAGDGSTQGNRGGGGLDNGTVASGGGGGGAMSAGGTAAGNSGGRAGQGGVGYYCDISGTFVAYGGGGGGGCALQAEVGLGGAGGGGNGAKNADTGVSGTANTGGGGGGAGNSSSPGSGAGGSGIVIVRYLT